MIIKKKMITIESNFRIITETKIEKKIADFWFEKLRGTWLEGWAELYPKHLNISIKIDNYLEYNIPDELRSFDIRLNDILNIVIEKHKLDFLGTRTITITNRSNISIRFRCWGAAKFKEKIIIEINKINSVKK